MQTLATGTMDYRISGSVVVAALWVVGCGQTSQTPAMSDAAGTTASGGGGAGGGSGGAGQAGTSNQAGTPNEAGTASVLVSCPELVTPQAGATAELDLKTALYFGDEELSPGQPNTLPGGSVLTPLNIRFYVTHVELLRPDGSAAAADLVDATGAMQPYGVQLVSTDDDETMRVHVRGAEGQYSGLRFLLGLDDSCNAGSMERKAPLSATSGMVWPPPFGYLFLRYEGMFSAAPQDTLTPPDAIHMGGLIGRLLAPGVTAEGAFTLASGQPTSASLRLALDKVFEAATAPVDIGEFVGPPGNEVRAGERLRLSAPTTPLFSVVQP